MLVVLLDNIRKIVATHKHHCLKKLAAPSRIWSKMDAPLKFKNNILQVHNMQCLKCVYVKLIELIDTTLSPELQITHNWLNPVYGPNHTTPAA